LRTDKRAKHLAVALRVFIACAVAMNGVMIPFLASPAKANTVGDDFSGILTDPLKLGKASDNILESVKRMQAMLDQAGSLEATTNAHLAARIQDVKDIVNKVLNAVDQHVADLKQIIADAELKIALLEAKMFQDIKALLHQVQCVAQNIGTQQLQQAIVSSLATLKAADPGIKILGFKIVGTDWKTVEVQDPDQMYRSLKAGYEKKLDNLRPTDSAYTIVSTYANLERLAENAGCAYSNLTISEMFVKEELKYEGLSEPWKTVSVVMGSNK
jgi:Holliday junction resolvasome RuvABC endonuclease subunit